MENVNIYKDLTTEALGPICNNIELNSRVIDNIVNTIIKPYCEALDDYVAFIGTNLNNAQTPPTTMQLEDYCLNLSTRLYFAGSFCEKLGVRDDISKAVYKEMYHSKRSNIEKGTVADKDSLAELSSQKEYVVNVCYTRAYKILKSKVETAQELLASCKKVLSHRIQEESLTNLGGNYTGRT